MGHAAPEVHLRQVGLGGTLSHTGIFAEPRNERGITIWLKAIAGPQGVQGVQGPAGKNGTNGSNGTNGTKGADGTNGTNGVNGHDGAQGPQGVSTPWTWSYTGGYGPDTNVQNDVWANDKYDTQFSVIPQTDGSYLIEKSITGTFDSVPGVADPNDGTGTTVTKGNVHGTITAVETWIAHGNFDPTATPDLNNMRGNGPEPAPAGSSSLLDDPRQRASDQARRELIAAAIGPTEALDRRARAWEHGLPALMRRQPASSSTQPCGRA